MQILLDEIIGKKIKIANASCKGLAGIEGTIIDETQNTLVIKTKKGNKHVPKAPCTFEIEGVKVKGKLFLTRPQERIKKILPKIR